MLIRVNIFFTRSIPARRRPNRRSADQNNARRRRGNVAKRSARRAVVAERTNWPARDCRRRLNERTAEPANPPWRQRVTGRRPRRQISR